MTIAGALMGLVYNEIYVVLDDAPWWFKLIFCVQIGLMGAGLGALPGVILQGLADYLLARRLGVHFLDVWGRPPR